MNRASTSFPTTLSDIQFSQEPDNDIYKTLKHLRKSTLSIPRRLRSIFADASFVQDLQQHLIRSTSGLLTPPQTSDILDSSDISDHILSWPLIANERAGSWYIEPRLKAGSAYFKSTDGHYGQWDFSLRRLNLTVLETLGFNGGAILVDSTRRGKEFPDALRRTVPIWVETWNRTLFPEPEFKEFHELQIKDLEPSEVAQIESRLGGFVKGLRSLNLPLQDLRQRLKRPIRCVWVSNAVDSAQVYETAVKEVDNLCRPSKCNILVLCSASRRVVGAEMSEDGYIQGAGDDSEGWSHGLTPDIAWTYKEQLMNSADETIEDLIGSLAEQDKNRTDLGDNILVHPTNNLYLGRRTLSDSLAEPNLLIDCNADSITTSPNTLNLGCRGGKLGSRDLKPRLEKVRVKVLEALNKSVAAKVFVTCSTGKDLSVGVAVSILCMFYDESGGVDLSQVPISIDKQLVKQRLAWITTSKPDANPSRSTLQAVNSFLITRPD